MTRLFRRSFATKADPRLQKRPLRDTTPKLELRRPIHSSAVSFQPKQGRYSILDLQKNRLWTQVAGLDPKIDRPSADVWAKYRHIASQAYFGADFDVSTPWVAQEPKKKEISYNTVIAETLADEVLKEYHGLRHPDVIAWRLCHFRKSMSEQLSA